MWKVIEVELGKVVIVPDLQRYETDVSVILRVCLRGCWTATSSSSTLPRKT